MNNIISMSNTNIEIPLPPLLHPINPYVAENAILTDTAAEIIALLEDALDAADELSDADTEIPDDYNPNPDDI